MATTESDGNERSMVLKVLKVEYLSKNKNEGYCVECTVDKRTVRTKTIKQKEEESTVEWKETFSFTVNDASKLNLRVFLVNNSFKKIKLFFEKKESRFESLIRDLRYDEDLRFRLVNPKEKTIMPVVLTIRCEWPLQSDAVGLAVDDAKKAVLSLAAEPNALDEVNTANSTAKQIKSIAESWKSLLTKLDAFNNIAAALSEIHPYVKAALSIVKLIPEAIIAQLERDKKILDLVGVMDDTYDLIKEGEHLKEVDPYRSIFKAMAMQTVECAYFIDAYVKDSFSKRAAESLISGAERAIQSYQDQFTKIKSSFRDCTLLNTAIQVHRIMDAVEDIHASINLNEIMYAEGMRFSLESCCLPDTRKEILEDIIEWANNTETENRVFILTGLAGSGKSSIAHSVASYFKSLDRLGSSFFCSRSNLVNSRPDKIFSTIARDLAEQNKQILQQLVEVVKMNKSLGTTRSVREQFQDLIKKATDGLTMIGPLVIVIDALDECEGDDRLRRELMRILALEASALPRNFRIFLTSRSSDMHVEEAFGMNSSVVLKGVVHRELLERVPRESTNHDIFIFIGKELSGVASDLIEHYPNWQINLRNESEGLFIYASTACKFIRGSSNKRGTLPIERYESLQKARSVGSSTGGAEPLKGVYELYSSILMSTFDPNDAIVMDRFRKVLGIVVTAYTTLSTSAIEELSNEDYAGRLVISELGSLLIGWDNAKLPVQVLHASFPDYLTNRDFSSYFYIDDKYRHSQMALLCLKLMNRKLEVKKFNICEFEDYYVFYNDMQPGELERRRDEHISEALQYACRHWAMHIAQMDPNDYGIIKKALHHFLFEGKHLMKWIEVLSILKYVDGVKPSMRAFFKWTKGIKETEPATHRLIYDCCRFLEGFSYPITLGPLHVYLSSLPYVPTRTPLYRTYSGISGLEPHVLLGFDDEWSLRRSRLPMNDTVEASVFSPDGTHVACIAESGEIQVYDFATSAPRGNAMQLKTGGKNSEGGKQNKDNDENEEGDGDVDGSRDSPLRYVNVALSPDRSKFAISHPKVIEVRDIASGAYIHSEEGFRTEKMKIPIVFQSDNVVVACHANDSNVKIWKYELDSEKTTIRTFAAADEVELVALSPNGVYAGGISCKRTVSVWDVNTEEQIVQFDVPGYRYVTALGVSSSGSVAVAYGLRTAMWSREGSMIWDKESEWSIWEIFMPLSTECGHFVTRGPVNLVWDMATGDKYRYKSEDDAALAISPDGQFLVTEKGTIYSVNGDEEEPEWEPSSDAEVNKPRLEENEYLRHVIILPSGSIIAAGVRIRTVFVWDRLQEADAAKQSLQENEFVRDVRIALDGMKVASRNGDDEILVWTRATIGANFELLQECNFENLNAAHDYLNNPSQWGASKGSETSAHTSLASQMDQPLNPGNVESDSAELLAEGSNLMYKENLEWVTTVEGKKLCWIPKGFRIYGTESTPSGHTIVVYGIKMAIIFKYINNVHT